MKTRMILAAMLLLAFGSVKAQETLIPVPDGDASKINTLVVSGTGSVYLKQGDKLMMNDYGHNTAKYHVEDSVLYLEGTGAREVTFRNLAYLKVSGTSGVRSKDRLQGKNLSISTDGVGEVNLAVKYDNIYVCSKGTGNVVLSGECLVYCGEARSLGKLNARDLDYMVKVEKSGDQWNMAFNTDQDLDNIKKVYLKDMVKNAQPFFEAESNRSWNLSRNDGTQNLDYSDMSQLPELLRELGEHLMVLSDSVDWKSFEEDMEKWGAEMEEWGKKMEKWGERFEDKHGKDYDAPRDHDRPTPIRGKRAEKKSLVFDPNWNGFEAGLNMLLTPGTANIIEGDYGFLETRPMKSWVFNFNIADVGIAFNRRHTAGLYTGIGLGWNNYSFNNPITLVKGENHLEYEPVNAENWKKSKLGVLYVQAPLMLEVRPTRRLFVAAGVTGGLRVDGWTKVKYQNGDKVKVHNDYYLNPLKLDASLRIGKNDGLGFFANYDLLPAFRVDKGPASHTFSFGFSLNF